MEEELIIGDNLKICLFFPPYHLSSQKEGEKRLES